MGRTELSEPHKSLLNLDNAQQHTITEESAVCQHRHTSASPLRARQLSWVASHRSQRTGLPPCLLKTPVAHSSDDHCSDQIGSTNTWPVLANLWSYDQTGFWDCCHQPTREHKYAISVEAGTSVYLLVSRLAWQGSLPARPPDRCRRLPFPPPTSCYQYGRMLQVGALIRTLTWITETLLLNSHIYFAFQAPCSQSQLSVTFLLKCTTPKKVSFRLLLWCLYRLLWTTKWSPASSNTLLEAFLSELLQCQDGVHPSKNPENLWGGGIDHLEGEDHWWWL